MLSPLSLGARAGVGQVERRLMIHFAWGLHLSLNKSSPSLALQNHPVKIEQNLELSLNVKRCWPKSAQTLTLKIMLVNRSWYRDSLTQAQIWNFICRFPLGYICVKSEKAVFYVFFMKLKSFYKPFQLKKWVFRELEKIVATSPEKIRRHAPNNEKHVRVEKWSFYWWKNTDAFFL